MSEAPDPIAGEAAVEPTVVDPVLNPAAAETLLGTAEGGEDTTTAPAGEGTESAPAGEDTTAASVYDFKLPEGFTPDTDAITEFTAFATEHKLSPEAAQSAIDKFFVPQLEAQAKAFAANQQQVWDQVNNTWKAELEADPEWAGEAKSPKLRVIGKALDEYGEPGVREAFSLTAAGNNPAIVKTFYKMAAALQEGTQVTAGNPAPKGPQTRGQSLYGDSSES